MPKKTKDEAGVRYRQDRLDLVEDVGDLYRDISRVAWREARIANAILERGERKEAGEKVKSWELLGTRDKQKATMDVLANILSHEEVRAVLVKAIMEKPLEALKIYVSQIPKEVEQNINFNQSTMILLPGKAGSIAAWMDMARGVKAIDGEVIGEAGANAAETWKSIMEQK